MLSVLAADRTRVAELEAQILVLEHSLSALRTEKLLAQERINSYKYPVLKLPNEIVSEIFIQFLPIYPLCPSLEGLFSPSTLTHICQRWREISIGNPMLWRAISFSSFSDNHTRHLQISQIWLDRSRDCPLSIVVDPYSDSGPEALAVLIPHRARWEPAELTLRPSELSPIRGPMPLLQHLNLSLAEIDGEAMIFYDIPQPRTAILRDFATLVKFPWAQLVSLTLYSVYREECLDILRHTYLICGIVFWKSSFVTLLHLHTISHFR
ncbi:hypothetical protein B0H14DRAFT_2560307 [Mycena olivaceomarginata]|nr:hypothetical protein B0H14DRAFT_2560307 [Mycena olivaceomarginata]